MSWQIKPFSHRCCITGNAFEDGARYVSYLVAHDEGEEFLRFDLDRDVEDRFQPEGEILCRWSRVYKSPPERENAKRKQKETAESLFVSLYESEDEEEDEERETMKQVLGIFLERKRILKDRGFSREGAYQVLEHRRTGNVFLVPTNRMTPRALLRIQEKLGKLMN